MWSRDASDADWMVKIASSEAESVRLQTEADRLLRAAHPGVVELGPVTTDANGLVSIRTRYAGPDLTRVGPLPAAEVAGLGAAIATILADLHDLGLVHGALSADHVLLDASGRPVLCGLALIGSDGADPAADIDALQTLLAGQLRGAAAGKLAKLLADRRRPGTARRLAESLAHCLPDTRLPSPDSFGAEPHAPSDLPLTETNRSAPPRSVAVIGPTFTRTCLATLSRSRWLAAAVVAAVLVVGVGLALSSARSGSGYSVVSGPAPCPTVDDGCGPVPLDHGMFTTAAGRFAIDLRPAVVVIGRWFCDRTALPAALDPTTGQIWAWRAWPGTTVLSARPVSRVSGAVGLRVRPGRSGCDALVVDRRDGAPIVVERLSRA